MNLGFIDNNKEGENIYKLDTTPKEYDQIHIVSVNNIAIFYFIILRFVRFNVLKIKSISTKIHFMKYLDYSLFQNIF